MVPPNPVVPEATAPPGVKPTAPGPEPLRLTPSPDAGAPIALAEGASQTFAFDVQGTVSRPLRYTWFLDDAPLGTGRQGEGPTWSYARLRRGHRGRPRGGHLYLLFLLALEAAAVLAGAIAAIAAALIAALGALGIIVPVLEVETFVRRLALGAFGPMEDGTPPRATLLADRLLIEYPESASAAGDIGASDVLVSGLVELKRMPAGRWAALSALLGICASVAFGALAKGVEDNPLPADPTV